jgi:transcriptional regulator with XRE-family HTH domain
MKKKYFTEQRSSKFISSKDWQEWLANCPDYKDQIRTIREALGMTQEQLAKKVDRTPRSIRTIENGEAFPRISTLQKIADALNAELSISLIPKRDISEFFNKKRKQEAEKLVEFTDNVSAYETQSPPPPFHYDYEETEIQIGEND